jgi:uncharacterized protein (TIGR03663 family)
MSSIAQEPSPALGAQRWLDRLLAIEIAINWGLVAYLGLFLIGLLLHFWDLGSRALHHDESLHATYSYYLFRGSGYKHDPLMHGPVLFHLTALMYFLFGASDAVSRFSAAFAGSALVMTPLFLRRWMGRFGALGATAMIVFSPAILYYSRFIREDIFVVLWTTGFFIGMWRYLQESRVPWLYLAAGCLALGFANKELTFMIAAVALIYSDVLLAIALSGPIVERYHNERLPLWATKTIAIAALVPSAWAIAAFWIPLRDWRRRVGLRALPLAGDLLIVIGTLTLPQLSALVQMPLKYLHLDLSAPAGNLLGTPLTTEGFVGGVTVLALLVASLAVGVSWNWRRWLTCALIFYAIFVCLFTTFFTNPIGFATGIWGSLDYWIVQQGVQRGGQPVFYYVMMLPAYAYLPLVLAAVGVFWRCIRAGRGSVLLLAGSLVLLPLIAAAYAVSNLLAIPLIVASLALAITALRGDPLRQLLLTWFGGLLFGLSVAGEKMPWLTIHLEVPLILLAGMTVGDLLQAALPAVGAWKGNLVRLGIAAVAGSFIGALGIWAPGSDGLHALIVLVFLLAAVAAAIWMARRTTAGFGLALAVTAVAGLLLTLSVRTAFALSYQHGDTPYEALVYTQSSPDIPRIMAGIDQYAHQSGLGDRQPIVVDAADAFSWPWAWYLRDYHQTQYVDLSPYVSSPAGYRPPAHAILLLNSIDQGIMSQFRGQFGPGIPYHHRWWFPEDYRGTTAGSFLKSLLHGNTWASWWGLLAGAHGIVAPPAQEKPGVHVIGSVDSIAYFPPDYTPGSGVSPAAQRAPGPRTSANGGLILGTPGAEGGAFLRPAAVAVASSGEIYVADSQNNRIQKFNSAGRLLATTTDAGMPSPLQEPWGVAVDPAGNVFVADTWNHRIVKLDSQMHFLTTWGIPTKPTGPESLLTLYGPRAIAIESSGNLLVTDTGNNRVVEFSPDGQPLGSFGSPGTAAGQFQEPVGIAIGRDGRIYVADTWNGRVDVFDSAKAFLGSYPVSGWESRDVENKPYLAVLPNGNLLVTQPNGDRVLELAPDGSTIRSDNNLAPDLPLSRPIGVATDSSGNVYITDGVNDQLARLPYSALP